jgi:hypothetical protein
VSQCGKEALLLTIRSQNACGHDTFLILATESITRQPG